MRCNWRRWLWGIIPILLLGWLAVWAERDRVEADLGERAKLALRQAGMDWATTRIEGRDAVLQGTAADDADPQKAADLLRGVWGVRVVDNNAGLVPMVDKFTWRAARRGQRIRLTGYVPSKPVRKTIVGVTKANFPGFEVVDRMNMARGVPAMDTWLAGVSFALKQLSALKRGDVLLEALDLSVAGEAEDVAAYRAVRFALSSPPKGIKLANNGVKAPTVSPYTWIAKLEARRLALIGHYPSDSAKDQLLTAARASLAGAAIQDSLLPAEGAPQDWAGAVTASVRALGRLESGSADLKDAALTVSGVAGDAATAEAVRVALRGALPPSIKLTEQIRAKEAPPPRLRPPRSRRSRRRHHPRRQRGRPSLRRRLAPKRRQHHPHRRPRRQSLRRRLAPKRRQHHLHRRPRRQSLRRPRAPKRQPRRRHRRKSRPSLRRWPGSKRPPHLLRRRRRPSKFGPRPVRRASRASPRKARSCFGSTAPSSTIPASRRSTSSPRPPSPVRICASRLGVTPAPKAPPPPTRGFRCGAPDRSPPIWSRPA